ncbi:hypothetical protein GCM10022239_26790 [Leifsonia bigeumensis]|uniref:Transcription regulator PadR N-terminal domain-containing protein n=2 Tax=Leifsonella bigeumensis TaxID=433643 RepID=A0ABP7FWE2_9MICO
MLTRLRTRGLVSSFDRASASGPVREYYRLTDAGTAELDAFRAQWAPFSSTVGELIGKDSTS